MKNVELEILLMQYGNQYKQPQTEVESIQYLQEIYRQMVGIGRITEQEKEGIADYYKQLLERRVSSPFYWFVDAIHKTRKKNAEKRTFGYMIGILRKWMAFGHGYVPSQGEADILEYFQEVTGLSRVSLEARKTLMSLMSNYGAIKLTRCIGQLSEEDISLQVTQHLSSILEELFKDREREPQYPSSEEFAEEF